LDDADTFTAKLIIDILDGKSHQLQLQAQGEGSTLCVSEMMANLDLGCMPINQLVTREFSVENRGSATQVIHWVNEKHRRNRNRKLTSPEEPAFFTIEPEITSLPAGQTQLFTLTGSSLAEHIVNEKFICFSLVDNTSTSVFESVITCQFACPILEIPKTLRFLWSFRPNEEPEAQVCLFLSLDSHALSLRPCTDCSFPCIEPSFCHQEHIFISSTLGLALSSAIFGPRVANRNLTCSWCLRLCHYSV
jgi:hypothetical protein